MQDVNLATVYTIARAAYEADPAAPEALENLMFAENDICERLEIPLDETEQGLTENACRMIDAFVAENA